MDYYYASGNVYLAENAVGDTIHRFLIFVELTV
jgi:hypothetical protein